MKHWWQGLATRERYLVISGGVLLLFFCIYQWGYKPVSANLAGLRTDIAAQQELLNWMQTTVPRILTLRSNTHAPLPVTTTQSVLSVVATTLEEHQLIPQTIEELSSQKVTVAIDQANFDPLFMWLTQLYEKNAIVVTDLILTPESGDGTVKARITLERTL